MMQIAVDPIARSLPTGMARMFVAPGRPAAEPARSGMARKLSKGETVFAEGDPTSFYYRVVSGSIRSYTLTSDGRRQIDAFHLPGDIFGLGTGNEHRVSTEAICRSSVIAYRRTDIDSLSESGLVRALMSALERAQDHALLLGRKSAVERIAIFLLDMAERMPDSRFDLPMSRADIGDYLGLSIETVSRSLTQLERDGLIEIPHGRRSIGLRDRAALERLEA